MNTSSRLARLKQKRKWNRISAHVWSIMKMLFILIKCTLYYFDIVADVYLAIRYLNDGKSLFASLTISPVLISYTISLFFNLKYKWDYLTSQLTDKHFIKFIEQILLSLMQLDYLFWCLKVCKWTQYKMNLNENLINVAKQGLISFETKIKQQSYIEISFESIPQLFLQLYLIHTYYMFDLSLLPSIVGSLLSITLTITTEMGAYYFNNRHKGKNQMFIQTKVNYLKYFYMFAYYFLIVSSRLIVNALILAVDANVAFICLGINVLMWFLMWLIEIVSYYGTNAFYTNTREQFTFLLENLLEKPFTTVFLLFVNLLYFLSGIFLSKIYFHNSRTRTRAYAWSDQVRIYSFFYLYLTLTNAFGILYVYYFDVDLDETYLLAVLYYPALANSLGLHFTLAILVITRLINNRKTDKGRAYQATVNMGTIYLVHEDSYDKIKDQEIFQKIKFLILNYYYQYFDHVSIDDFDQLTIKDLILNTKLLIYVCSEQMSRGDSLMTNIKTRRFYERAAEYEIPVILIDRAQIRLNKHETMNCETSFELRHMRYNPHACNSEFVYNLTCLMNKVDTLPNVIVKTLEIMENSYNLNSIDFNFALVETKLCLQNLYYFNGNILSNCSFNKSLFYFDLDKNEVRLVDLMSVDDVESQRRMVVGAFCVIENSDLIVLDAKSNCFILYNSEFHIIRRLPVKTGLIEPLVYTCMTYDKQAHGVYLTSPTKGVLTKVDISCDSIETKLSVRINRPRAVVNLQSEIYVLKSKYEQLTSDLFSKYEAWVMDYFYVYNTETLKRSRKIRLNVEAINDNVQVLNNACLLVLCYDISSHKILDKYRSIVQFDSNGCVLNKILIKNTDLIGYRFISESNKEIRFTSLSGSNALVYRRRHHDKYVYNESFQF